MKNTSTDPDGIIIYFVKRCGLFLWPFIVDIIYSIFLSDRHPCLWKKANVISINKITNFSDISESCGLDPLALKLFAWYLINRNKCVKLVTKNSRDTIVEQGVL